MWQRTERRNHRSRASQVHSYFHMHTRDFASTLLQFDKPIVGPPTPRAPIFGF
jgi:hypothetical protein